MIKVMETFSGIGAQAKALSRQDEEYEIVATADWDVNAIIAYDIIHHGTPNIEPYEGMPREEVIEKLSQYTLSPDGKDPYKGESLKRVNEQFQRYLLAAIERSNNLGSITDMTYEDIPENLDVLTYSFPCQNLSLAGVWRGELTGIDRDADNRSGMLWEVERILMECEEHNRRLPRFLLMENVSNILSARHKDNFEEWKSYLNKIGYENVVYKLDASKFGVPQIRKRVFMISIYVGNDARKIELVNNYITDHDLENENYVNEIINHRLTVRDIIKNDYTVEKYHFEALNSQMNNTPSREKIVQENRHLFKNNQYENYIRTVTTKQDRNPNSGVVQFENEKSGKLNWRYLTPRECFLSMGFDEEDYEALMEHNVKITKSRYLFSDSKLIKMAGNSIVVNVLEAIFHQIIELKEILQENDE
ncbi:DNA (cytosine-5)-methyltransferase 1 [Granulicatella balaenopterae]|uniref:Cytosine-specific methyltransferase n=2 Tax=Granulicatella balaenopterae TaxID=137733 RepID=A0A1H9N5W2_9LACT|nr:DNA (cytosine-5)-methyltransferase 1 [Granulicatella balaenopterae]